MPVRPRLLLALLVLQGACGRAPEPPAPAPAARNLVLITIDTLRADRVGSYGYAAGRTPAIDTLAAQGVRFERAYAPAPITLTAHASLLSGRYPPGHGARHNGMPVDAKTPLLAETLTRAGFATAAFVAAFPLDRRFGLDRGFQIYSDRMPRRQGRQADERPGEEAATEAIHWLQQRSGPFFLWVHLFEPHAPYGAPGDSRPVQVRYDDEVSAADRQVGRVVDALGANRASTVIVVTADHGEAFGEHGELTHSLFVYDTTLRVPLIVAGPGIAPRVVDAPVGLIDVAPTVLPLLNAPRLDADGIDLGAAMRGASLSGRTLYAESFAPLLDFGWSPLRSIREDGWKLIAAPRPELYRVSSDPSEAGDLASSDAVRLAAMLDRVQRYSPAELGTPASAPDPEAAARLQALGYVGSGARAGGVRADPKDRRELAADLARVTSGELQGAALEAALRRIVAVDPGNPQANMRLGFALQASGRCAEAVRHFESAIGSRIPGADAYLGLAECQVRMRHPEAALRTLQRGAQIEPGNAVVAANLGLVLSDSGRPAEGLPHLTRAVSIDPDFHQARFNLALAFARLGHRVGGLREAQELLKRLPADAPQRAEVERLVAALR